ncbi:MAG TPA: hypothetical protein PLQ97_15065 [Myxococcota bacterium]|nr:hypothetical protein [Myxococcota bacterium]HQK52543.1 hypothetical protein [Myxococcota bacterium]
MTPPGRSPRRTLWLTLVLVLLVPGPAGARPPVGESGAAVLEPQMEPVIRDIFRAVRDCRVQGIAIRGGVVEALLDPGGDGDCRVVLVAPGEPVEDGMARRPGATVDMTHSPTCPVPCIEQVQEGIRSVGGALRFVKAGPPPSTGEGPQVGRVGAGRPTGEPWNLGPEASLALVALLGLALVAILIGGLPRAVRRVWAWDHGWVLLVLLGGAGLVLLGEALTATLRSGDEWINQSYVLTATWSALNQGQYPHPALYFEVLAALNGFRTLVHVVITGQGLLDASLDLAIRRPFDAILMARGLSIVCWLGVVAVVWRLATRFGGAWWTGLLAALVVVRGEQLYPSTLSPYPLGILLTVLAIEIAWWEAREAGPRRVALSGICMGAAVGTHYLSALFAPLALLVFWLVPGPLSDKVRLSLRWGLWVVAGFLATNPRLPWDLPNYLHFWHYRVQELRVFDPNNDWMRPADSRALSPAFYWDLFRGRDLRGAMLAGGLAFLAAAVRRREPRLLFPLLLGALPVAVLSVVQTRYEHYLQFLLPGAAVLAFAWLPIVMPDRMAPRFQALAALPLAAFLAWVPSLGQPPMAGWGRGVVRSDPYGAAVAWVRSRPEVRDRLFVSGLPMDVVGPVLDQRGAAMQVGREAAAMLFRDTGLHVQWRDVRAGGLDSVRDRPWVTIGEVTAVPTPPGDGWLLVDWIQQGGLEFRLWVPREGGP